MNWLDIPDFIRKTRTRAIPDKKYQTKVVHEITSLAMIVYRFKKTGRPYFPINFADA